MSGMAGVSVASPRDAELPSDAKASRAGLAALVRERAWLLAVWVAMVAWTIVLGFIVRGSYEGFRLARFDLGNMVQAVWSTAHGHPLEQTNAATGEQMVRLGSHVDPILVLFTPFWLAWPSPLVLAFVQIAAVSLGALPVFWLARRHLGSEKLACLLALAYLAYPWLSWTAVDSMHPITLAIPFLLFGLWFLDHDRLRPFVLCAVLAMLSRALLGPTVAALGIWYAVARGKKKQGLSIAGFGLAWFLIGNFVLKPIFSGGPSDWVIYGTLGGSPGRMVATVFTHPDAVVSLLLRSNVILYLALLTLPVAGLCFLSPGIAAVAVPQLLVNGLADGAATTDPRQHYIAAIVPFLFAGMIFGLARLPSERRGTPVLLALSLSVVLSAVFGPWPLAPGRTPLWYQTTVPARRVVALEAATSLVPPGAAVASTNKVGSHLSARRYVYTLPVIGRATWVVVDTSDPWLVDPTRPFLVRRPKALRLLTARLRRSAGWANVFDEEGVLVFRRTSAA